MVWKWLLLYGFAIAAFFWGYYAGKEKVRLEVKKRSGIITSIDANGDIIMIEASLMEELKTGEQLTILRGSVDDL